MNSSKDTVTEPIDENTVDSSSQQGASNQAEDPKVINADDIISAADADAEESGENLDESEEAFIALNEKYLRLNAELDNVQKRARSEMDNTRKYAIKGFATELLSVKDSLELATNVDLSNQEDDVVLNMHKGLVLTLKQLDQVFEKFNIEAISPNIGDKLDPEIHQAMSMQDSEEVEANGIMMVFQKGYKLSGRLIRPAMVVVAK